MLTNIKNLRISLEIFTIIPDWPSADRKPQSSAPVAMDTGNPWDSSSGGGGGSGAEPGAVQDPPTTSASSAAAHAQNAPPTSKADEEQLVRSSTPPEDGWANFGEFESSAAAVSSSSSGEKNGEFNFLIGFALCQKWRLFQFRALFLWQTTCSLTTHY